MKLPEWLANKRVSQMLGNSNGSTGSIGDWGRKPNFWVIIWKC